MVALGGSFASGMMKILVFAPHSAIWIHAFPEALVAESLRESGHDIFYVTCGGLLQDYCIPMSASGMKYNALPAEKRQICERCGRNANLIRREFGFDGQELASSVSVRDRAETEVFLSQVTMENFRSIELDGLPVGRFALYQFLILRKKIGFVFTEGEWDEYQVHLRATILASVAIRRILDVEKPARILLYNGLYSVNMVCRELAAKREVACYFLHAGGALDNRLQTLMIGRDQTFRFYPALISHWARFRSIPITQAAMRPATNHFIELLRGRSAFAYSPSKSDKIFNIRTKFGIVPEQRIVVATMGSYDEEFAAEAVGARVHAAPALFPTQADWLIASLDFVAKRQDLFLIIRVHPRELPNRREGVKSEHAGILEGLLTTLPPNAAVNWPTDAISLYDLAEETDVFLNSWSSVGKEMSMLGRPVVTYAKDIIFYPAELNYTGDSRESYFGQIDQALLDGWSAERIRLIYRWLAIEYGTGLLHIGDSYKEREHRPRSFPTRALHKLRRALDPDYTQRRDCSGRAARLGVAGLLNKTIEQGAETILDIREPLEVGRVSETQETASLRKEVQRLLPHLYSGDLRPKAGTLHAFLRGFVENAGHDGAH